MSQEGTFPAEDPGHLDLRDLEAIAMTEGQEGMVLVHRVRPLIAEIRRLRGAPRASDELDRIERDVDCGRYPSDASDVIVGLLYELRGLRSQLAESQQEVERLRDVIQRSSGLIANKWYED